jgi:DNA-binding response OmpR family regulator
MATRSAILILEDEYLIAATLAEYVAASGYRVVGPVAAAEEAQELINEKGIDAALLDVRLAGDLRSFDLAVRLQAMRVPFAFVTAFSSALFPAALRDAPILVKPASLADVAKLLHALLPLSPGA